VSTSCADVVRALFSAVASVAQDENAQADVDYLLAEDVVYVEDPLWPGSYRCRCDDGRISYYRAYLDPDAALAAD
jgi:ketosteroid isomerase-like protein